MPGCPFLTAPLIQGKKLDSCVCVWLIGYSKTSSSLQTVPSFGVRYTCDRDFTSPKSSSVKRPHPMVRRASGRRAAFGMVVFALDDHTELSSARRHCSTSPIITAARTSCSQLHEANTPVHVDLRYRGFNSTPRMFHDICLSIARRRRSSRDLRVLRLISNLTSTKFRCRSQRRQCQCWTLYM